MKGQINLFDYVAAINNPEIRIKEIINRVKENIVSKGYKCEWVDKVADPNECGTCFVKNGKGSYKSTCHNYEGYYLSGGGGSVQCKCAGLLPGIIGYEICFKEDLKCPYLEQEERKNE